MLLGSILLALPAAAGQRVSLELVLAVDVSLSVNDIEYRLQMEGIAQALQDPDIVRLIRDHEHGVAVLITQWSGTRRATVPLPWTVMREEPEVFAYASQVTALQRPQLGNYTALGHAISFAVEQIANNGLTGDERTVDVSGDGQNNSGPLPEVARLEAVARQITVNGLAVTNIDPRLASYYAGSVIAGPGAFVIQADDFASFASAFNRKLRRELSPKIALQRPFVRVAGAQQ